jgi:hypothetical protein
MKVKSSVSQLSNVNGSNLKKFSGIVTESKLPQIIGRKIMFSSIHSAADKQLKT